MLESLFNKVTGLKTCNFVKKRLPTPVFSCEYCEIRKNTYFEEHMRTAAFDCSMTYLEKWKHSSHEKLDKALSI